LIALTPEARRHVRALYAYYEERERPEAARALRNALTAAWEKISTSPGGGPVRATALPAAWPTGQGMAQGRALLDCLSDPPTTAIVAVFFETANIPGRV
jgi:plasmid stabilization system protein ParE